MAEMEEARLVQQSFTYDGPIDVVCMTTSDEKCDFKPMKLKRRPVQEFDVLIKMKYCGVCHTDLHVAANHYSRTVYPCVPGHELAGTVVKVGSGVTKVKVGSNVGVGYMVDSCGTCRRCGAHEEQTCKNYVATSNGRDKSGRAATYPPGGTTIGGYTNMMVVHEKFAIVIPETYPLEFAGPIMCSGITVFHPLQQQQTGDGSNVAIVGLGGVGQMGIRLAKALGANVTVVSRGTKKKAFALECGADMYIDCTNEEEIKKASGSIDTLLNTIPIYHDYCFYNSLLKNRGKQVLLGAHKGWIAAQMSGGSKKVTSSFIGSVDSTQAVIDLCDKNKIYPEVKIVPVEKLNWVFEQLENNTSGLRYVLDLGNTLKEDTVCDADPPNIHEQRPEDQISKASVVAEICKFLCCCRGSC